MGFALTILPTLVKYRIYLPLKGRIGETKLKAYLSTLDKSKYTILSDVLLINDEVSNQIDFLILSVYGIFIVESKNYSGIITGSDYDKKWTQKLGRNKYYFMNPLHQVYGQSETLKKVLNKPDLVVIPVIVFSINAELKAKTTQEVTYLIQAKKFIKSFGEEVYSIEEIEQFKHIIESSRSTSKADYESHIETTQQKQSNKENTCPKCGGQLVLRHGKHGDFLGCKNYPSCRFTSNIKNQIK